MSNEPYPRQSTLDRYVLPDEKATGVSVEWFSSQRTRYPVKNEHLKRYLVAELDALESFHNGTTCTEDAAKAITQPIVDGPIPNLNSYSDDITAMVQLWDYIFRDALMEWPPSRTKDLIHLLSAISEIKSPPHQGRAMDEEEPLTWHGLPYFVMAWSDAHWMSPGQITRRCKTSTERDVARQKYIHQLSIESQLVAAGYLPWRMAIEYVVNTLEADANDSDNATAPDDAVAETQIHADFNFPALALWFRYNGKWLREYAASNDVGVRGTRQFGSATERWVFWRTRLKQVSEADGDDIARRSAADAIEYMSMVETDLCAQ